MIAICKESKTVQALALEHTIGSYFPDNKSKRAR
jgi:hypothetical protein